jgi:hypothetical protein
VLSATVADALAAAPIQSGPSPDARVLPIRSDNPTAADGFAVDRNFASAEHIHASAPMN